MATDIKVGNICTWNGQGRSTTVAVSEIKSKDGIAKVTFTSLEAYEEWENRIVFNDPAYLTWNMRGFYVQLNTLKIKYAVDSEGRPTNYAATSVEAVCVGNVHKLNYLKHIKDNVNIRVVDRPSYDQLRVTFTSFDDYLKLKDLIAFDPGQHDVNQWHSKTFTISDTLLGKRIIEDAAKQQPSSQEYLCDLNSHKSIQVTLAESFNKPSQFVNVVFSNHSDYLKLHKSIAFEDGPNTQWDKRKFCVAKNWLKPLLSDQTTKQSDTNTLPADTIPSKDNKMHLSVKIGGEPVKFTIKKQTGIKAEAKKAIYRVAATQTVKLTQGAIVSALRKSGKDNHTVDALATILATEYGKAGMSLALGIGLDQLKSHLPASLVDENEMINNPGRVTLLAKELRINGLTVAGNEIMETIFAAALEALTSSANERVRVSNADSETDDSQILSETESEPLRLKVG